MMRLPKPSRRAQHGVSMIEAMVSVLIVSMGILALAGLLATSGRLAKTSELRATATMLANDMADRLRANPAGAVAGNYTLTPDALASALPTLPTDCTIAAPCAPAGLASKDLADWQAALFNQLPSGTGYIAMDSGNASDRMVDLWVMWAEPRADGDNSAAAEEGLSRASCPPGFDATNGVACLYFRVGR